MRRLLPVLLLSLAALPAHAATTQVVIRGSAYEPPTVTVAAGDTVAWTNEDSAEHTVTGDNVAEFDSGRMAKGVTYSRTFPTAGTFAYRCTIHTGMRGTVVVQAASAVVTTSSTTTSSTTSTSTTTT
ncbi:MAG: plastocyanin/azurin family copper-binding protein, partial [Actinomycetota bacterium]|nr:plastocyanin/azurin family copper-binding protein [Actinomycetota bacterium]